MPPLMSRLREWVGLKAGAPPLSAGLEPCALRGQRLEGWVAWPADPFYRPLVGVFLDRQLRRILTTWRRPAANTQGPRWRCVFAADIGDLADHDPSRLAVVCLETGAKVGALGSAVANEAHAWGMPLDRDCTGFTSFLELSVSDQLGLLYRAILGRDVDPPGAAISLHHIVSGQRTILDVRDRLVLSNEFQQRRQAEVALQVGSWSVFKDVVPIIRLSSFPPTALSGSAERDEADAESDLVSSIELVVRRQPLGDYLAQLALGKKPPPELVQQWQNDHRAQILALTALVKERQAVRRAQAGAISSMRQDFASDANLFDAKPESQRRKQETTPFAGLANISQLIWPAMAVGYRYAAAVARMVPFSVIEAMRGNYSPTAVESASFLDPAPRLLFDLSDVFVDLRDHDTVSGIQRVQLGIVGALLSATISTPYRAVFLTAADGEDGYVEIETIYLARLISELKKPRVSHSGLKDIIFSASRNGYRYRCRKGDVVLFLGAFWAPPNAIEKAADLKEQGAVIGILVHDIIPFTHPELCDTSHTNHFNVFFPNAMEISDFILTVSDYSGRVVKRYFERQGTNNMPIMTLRSAHKTWDPPIAASPPSKKIASILAEPYVLYVSTIEIRKNHLFLFQIWKMLLAAGDVAVPLLVFAGRPGHRVRDLMDQIESTHSLEGRIRMVHGVSDTELAELYRHAQFTVFPSFEEGWGLPVGESLIFGRPCIASNTSSIPEVGGEFVDYVDPFNATGGYQVIRRFITDADYREQRAAHIQRDFKPRVWDDVAHDLVRLVAKVTADRDFSPRPLPRPTLEAGRLYEFGHANDEDHFNAYGSGRIVHCLFDANWCPIDGTGRWMRAPAGRIIFNAQLESASSIVIMLAFKAFGWIAGDQIAVSIASKPVGFIDPVDGSGQWATFVGLASSGMIEIKFEIVGQIASRSDLDSRKDLRFGLRAIAYVPATNLPAGGGGLESALTTTVDFSAITSLRMFL